MTEWRRAGGALRALWSTPGPSAAVALGAGAVDAVQLTWRGGAPAIAGRAHADLAPGLLAPGVTGANVGDAAALSKAVGGVLDRLPRRPARVALIVPDAAAMVSILPFETLPARAAERDELVRWRAGRAAPFDVDEARVAWTPGAALDGGGREVVAALMRRDVLASYEQVCVAAGAHPGVVDLAGFNVINAVLAAAPAARAESGAESGAEPGPEKDWLFVQAGGATATLAIVRGGALVFFRHQAAADGEGLADLVHQTAMYHQDRLAGRGFARTLLAGEAHLSGAPGGRDAVRRALEERVGGRVEWLGAVLAGGVEDRTGADRAALDALAAPVGVLVRDARRMAPRAA